MLKLPRLIIITCLLSGTCKTFATPVIDSTIKAQTDTVGNPGIQLIVTKTIKGANLSWKGSTTTLQPFSIQFSSDGNRFTTIYKNTNPDNSFQDTWPAGRVAAYYRIEFVLPSGTNAYSNIVMIATATQAAAIQLQTNPVIDQVKLKIANPVAQSFTTEWRSAQGTLMQTQNFAVSAGVNFLQFAPPSDATPGTYYLRVISDDKKQRQLFRVVKQ